MTLAKKLKTGTIIRTWNFDEGNTCGQTVAVKDGSTGCHNPLFYIESVKYAEGIKNRIVFKRSLAEKAGFIIIEE